MTILNKLFNWLNTTNKESSEKNLNAVLDAEPKTPKDLKKAFKKHYLKSKFNLIEPLVRPKIDFVLITSDDDKVAIGQSKIGGKPDLELNTKWPTTNANKSLSFIGQINCSEITQHDISGLLPKSGLISFFYCADQSVWGFDPKDIDRFKVIYTESMENLQRLDFPSDLEAESRFQPNEMKFGHSLSLPGWEHHSIDGFLTDDEHHDYIELSGNAKNQLLGYANCVQNPMELQCQLVTNGLYCGDSSGYEDPRREELDSGKDDWVLLFQIDSDMERTGMMWGDAGKLYYWIRKQDLKHKNFEKSWLIFQCL